MKREMSGPDRGEGECGDDAAQADRVERSALASRIRWALARSGITMAAAERAAGLSPGTVGHVLSGRRPGARLGVARARLLAAALPVSAAWLLLGDGPAFWRVRLWASGGLGGSLGLAGRYLGERGDEVPRDRAARWAGRGEAEAALSLAASARQRGEEGALGWDAYLTVVGVRSGRAKSAGRLETVSVR